MFGSPTDRIIGKVGISLRRRDLAVPEQPADDVEILPAVDPETGEGMPQVVDPDIGKLGFLANPLPNRLQAPAMRVRLVAGNHEDLVLGPFEPFEDGHRGTVEQYRSLACLRVRQVKAASLDVDILPPEPEDLGRAATGEDQ